MHLSGTVMEIWRLKDMYTDTQTHGTMDTHTDKTTNLIISSNVHYCLHMAEITKLNNSIRATLQSKHYKYKLFEHCSITFGPRKHSILNQHSII